ncbi:ATP-dependent RNA helicase Prp43 [Ophiocordyceps sinensis CO18]|uniref:ATP-dependent RNA helicase Prp43 n=1 Tax=Ophiocordyceps sinensis (strain Co18 / CGMCC 3.14243) TaxID=911162 RepID=T5AFT0_OPHSC|nr:ATP-dependent RNA helicase Prp43 [Ophiocordyceps sinensis CO18]
MVPSTEPAIRTVSVDSAILRLVATGYRKAIDFDWIDAPHPESIARAAQDLRDWGYLKDDAALTPSGHLAAKCPLDPIWYRARPSLRRGETKLGCSMDIVDIALLCSSQTPKLRGDAAMELHSLMGEAMGSRVAGLSYEVTMAGRKIKVVKKDIAAPRARDIRQVADAVSRINRQPDLVEATERTSRAVNAPIFMRPAQYQQAVKANRSVFVGTYDPAHAQRFMDRVLRPHRAFSRAFIDDIVIYSKSEAAHLKHLRTIFQLFTKLNLTMSPTKS